MLTQAEGVRGRLFQCVRILAGPGADERARYLCFLWFPEVGTFEELKRRLSVSKHGYYIHLDTRLLPDTRVAKPGFLVMGKKRQEDSYPTMVGVFIPVGTETEVARQMSREFGAVIFLERTILEIASAAVSVPIS